MNAETEQEVKIGKLEVKMEGVEKNVEKIMSNHLPHIQAKIDAVHDKQTYWGGALAVLVVIVPIIINLISK